MKTDDIDTPVDEALLLGDEVAADEADDENEDAADKDIDTGADDSKDDAGTDEDTDDSEEFKDDANAESKKDDAADEDAADDTATTSQKDTKDGKGFVPMERFNQVYAELKQLKEASLVKEDKTEVEKPVDIKALRSQATEALLDGDTDKFNEIQEQIDNEILKKAESTAEARYSKRQEDTAFKQTAIAMVTKYPVLDDKTGNKEAIEMVVDLRDSYIAKGMDSVTALETAANKIAPLFTEKTAAAEDEEKVEKKTDERKLKAVERGVKDSEKLPPNDGGVGSRAQTDKEKREPTQEEWDKMSQEERDRRLAA